MLKTGVPVLLLGGEGVSGVETICEPSVRSLPFLSLLSFPRFISWISGKLWSGELRRGVRIEDKKRKVAFTRLGLA